MCFRYCNVPFPSAEEEDGPGSKLSLDETGDASQPYVRSGVVTYMYMYAIILLLSRNVISLCFSVPSSGKVSLPKTRKARQPSIQGKRSEMSMQIVKKARAKKRISSVYVLEFTNIVVLVCICSSFESEPHGETCINFL